ncbi:MAG: rhomboid family intramembrane serine protease [Rhodobacteraceae bacterium]|nr:rhomboid family intramembrane serine protease [Paracoccaceae bacterium]
MAAVPVKKGPPVSSDPDASPVNPLPLSVVILALPIVFVELALVAGAEGFVGGPDAVGWRLSAMQDYAFFGPVFDLMLELGRFPPEHLMRFVTYPFVHVGFTHMLMVMVFLLALGKMAGEVLGAISVLVLFFSSAIVGALVFALATDDPSPLLGGYPAVYGLIGAYTFILWVRLGQVGEPRHQAFSLIAVLLFIQLVFGLLFGTGQDWVAEIAGFVTGFALSPLVAPSGWTRLLERLRQR